MEEAQKSLGHGRSLCGAKKKQDDGVCQKPAGWGTDHPGHGPCRLHGGATPTVAKSAREEQVKAEARRTLGRLQAVPVDDPLTELKKLAGEAVAWKNLLADHVAELERLRYENPAGGEQVRGEIVLFERALDRCASILAAIARLNIDDRLARITERQADIVIRAIEAALETAGVRGEAAVEARKVAARYLRAV